METSSSFSLRLKGIIAALWTGNLLAPMLMSGVAAMLPSIGASLGASTVELTLIMVCYSLGQTVSQLISGRMCSIHGVKRFLLFSMGLFVVLGLLLAVSVAMPMVIGLRLGHGLAAGAISCCVTTLSFTLAPPEHRGKVIAIVLSAVYLGLTMGPLFCGGLTEVLGWRLVFLLVSALGCIVFLVLRSGLPADAPLSEDCHFDVPGAMYMFFGLSAITLGVTCTFLHPAVIWLFPAGIILTGLFIRHDWHSSSPILELRILVHVRGVLSGLLAIFVNYGSSTGLAMFFSLYLQQVLGLNAFLAGIIMMVQSGAQLLASIPAGGLSDRFGAAKIASLGLAISALGLINLIMLDQNSTILEVCLCEVLLGGGVGVFAAPSMAATLGNVPRPQISVASGLLGCTRTFGSLMSNIIISCVMGFFMADAVVSPENANMFLGAMRYAMLLFSAMNFVGLVVMLGSARRR